MSCIYPRDQFYILPNQYKPIRNVRSPESLHIESSAELESAIDALIVSDDPPRPRKSSLAKPREDNIRRTTKCVSFSGHVSTRTIPARKLPILTGFDLYDIMAVTDDEFTSFLGRQPDSPAPWQSSTSNATWISRELPPTALPVGPRTMLRLLSSTRPTQVKRIRSRRHYDNRATTQPSASAWQGHFGTKRGASLCRASVGLRYVHSAGLRAQQIGDNLPLGCTSSSVRSRQAFLRHLRQIRQQHAARLHNTPLRRRRVQRHSPAIWQRSDGMRRQSPVPKRQIGASDRPDHVPPIPRSAGPAPSLSPDQKQIKMPPCTSSLGDVQLAKSVAQRVRTYVDHIREQRSSPRPLHAHSVPEPIRKVLRAVSN